MQTPRSNAAKSPIQADSSPAHQGRTRSRIACQTCNRRKVKCDVSQTGAPCSNCRGDGAAACITVPRKKHRPRRQRNATNRVSHGSQSTTAQPSTSQPGDQDSLVLLEEHATTTSSVPDLEDNANSYMGDGRGPRLSVYHLCHPQSPDKPSPVVAKTVSAHRPHELEYLRLSGAFTPLPEDLYTDLIRTYFHHVHFSLPIIDAARFLTEFHSNGTRNISPLLLWSMLLASANFTEPHVLSRAGFTTRKALKTAMYERAKCLYDLDRGTDKVTLAQSVTLLAFWYSDAQDHTGSWYWIGIAVSMLQSMGFHRSPTATRSHHPPEISAALVSRMWWAVVVRDCWVSLAKGRPMRIHTEDCDASKPLATYVSDELRQLPSALLEAYLPHDIDALCDMWCTLVTISDNLGGIQRLHYKVTGPAPTRAQVEKYDRLLRDGAAMTLDYSTLASDELKIHYSQLQLSFQASVAILYRPFVLNSISSNEDPSWPKIAAERAHEAAASTNAILQRLIELDGIRYLRPMIIMALIPAMQIHLLDCKSTNSLISSLGSNKLQLCMIVLEHLRQTYWSANVMYRLFQGAHDVLKQSAPATRRSSVGPTRPAADGEDDTGMDVTFEPEASTELADEMTSFWFDPSASGLDQLLSPGFSLYDDRFQDFVAMYPLT